MHAVSVVVESGAVPLKRSVGFPGVLGGLDRRKPRQIGELPVHGHAFILDPCTTRVLHAQMHSAFASMHCQNVDLHRVTAFAASVDWGT
jgi:hypothetical protein